MGTRKISGRVIGLLPVGFGSTVGIGTLMFAFGVGPAVSLGLTIVNRFSTVLVMAADLKQDHETHERWMREALVLAQRAADVDEVPVGAIVVKDSEIIGRGFNEPIRTCDPTAHAEIVALRSASQSLKNYRLPGTTLYVTIEPCTMCLGAMIHARVGLVVFGATEPRAGALLSKASSLDTGHYNHQLSFLPGVLEKDCSMLLQNFFRERRKGK